MSQPYLEVTYRKGRPLAAYLYLDRRPGDASVRTQRAAAGLLVDHAADGRVIGVEITAPRQLTLAALNAALAAAHAPPAEAADLAPLPLAG